ncbi:MAG TPA: DUF424 family protein [Candidatus Thermoplasmatota archaeon]|nr:DUF424 family protein [Candidatus Thermoplasmatota archaeon]
MARFAVKNYQQGAQCLLAACDEELLGTSHREGRFKLDVPPGFYDGFRVNEAEFTSHLRSCTVANLVGRRAVDVAIRLGFVDPKNILVVQGVPHAQLLVMEGS